MSILSHTRADLSALERAPTWLNSEPLTAARLRGHPVLVDFWTFSCVNWLRTLPYLRAWHGRYRDRGFVLIGAHAPEFGFEHDLANVRRAVTELGIDYPVAIDNEFSIWQSFANRFWPAVYLLDGDGRICFHHFGEGNYAETERAIQELLGLDEPVVDVEASGLAEAADWDDLRSPETYLGFSRGERRGDAGRDALALNEWALQGAWSVSEEAAVLQAAGGSIAYRFEARDVNLVVTPPSTGDVVPFVVRLDGEPPGADHGVDVDASGDGVVDEPRMYQLVRQRAGAAQRTFEITFVDPGVHAYVFTFG